MGASWQKAAMTLLAIDQKYLPQVRQSVLTVCNNWPNIEQTPIYVVHYKVPSFMLNALLADVRHLPCDVRFELWNAGSKEQAWPSWVHPDTAVLWTQGTNEETIQDGWCSCNGNALSCGAVECGRTKKASYKSYGIGYCLMGYFRTRFLFDLTVFHSYDWLINLDSNLMVTRPLPYNPVQFMARHGKLFGMLSTQKRTHDASDACYTGHHTAIRLYMQTHEIDPVDKTWPPPDYSGNFFIAYLPYYRSRAFTGLANWIAENTTGLFTHRWGEQALFSAALMTCYNLNAIACLQ